MHQVSMYYLLLVVENIREGTQSVNHHSSIALPQRPLLIWPFEQNGNRRQKKEHNTQHDGGIEFYDIWERLTIYSFDKCILQIMTAMYLMRKESDWASWWQ